MGQAQPGVSKTAIFAAARKLAAEKPPSQIRAADFAALCDAAAFDTLFPNLLTFQLEFLYELFADARQAVVDATEHLTPGLGQLETAFTVYLDYNLAHPQLQELAHAVQVDVEGWRALQALEDGVTLVAQVSLTTEKIANAAARARMLTSMAVTGVRAEYRARSAQTKLREALMFYVRQSSSLQAR